MTLLLSAEDVTELATDDIAIQAMRRAFDAEARGSTVLPVRLDAPSPSGFLRAMPAILDGHMGCKIMTLARDSGTRYLVLLYSAQSGELIALLDADELTKVRTAATTALAADHLGTGRPQRVAVIGSGFEARGHIALFSRLWELDEVAVYSRSAANRADFAAWAADQLDLVVRDAPSCADAVAGVDTVLLATKSPVPVVDGDDLPSGAVVLSIGSTRPDLRELDVGTLRRADVLVVDAEEQVLAESGDVMEAVEEGALDRARIRPLAQLIAAGERVTLPDTAGSRDLLVFKSAGTALQDLALAAELYERATKEGKGRDIGEVSRLKPFNGKG